MMTRVTANKARCVTRSTCCSSVQVGSVLFCSCAVNEPLLQICTRTNHYYEICPAQIFRGVSNNQRTAVLRPLCRSTCVSRHLQLRTGGFCWCRVLLPACPCWWQPAHAGWGEDAGILLRCVICTFRLRRRLFLVTSKCCEIKRFHEQAVTIMVARSRIAAAWRNCCIASYWLRPYMSIRLVLLALRETVISSDVPENQPLILRS